MTGAAEGSGGGWCAPSLTWGHFLRPCPSRCVGGAGESAPAGASRNLSPLITGAGRGEAPRAPPTAPRFWGAERGRGRKSGPAPLHFSPVLGERVLCPDTTLCAPPQGFLQLAGPPKKWAPAAAPGWGAGSPNGGQPALENCHLASGPPVCHQLALAPCTHWAGRKRSDSFLSSVGAATSSPRDPLRLLGGILGVRLSSLHLQQGLQASDLAGGQTLHGH